MELPVVHIFTHDSLAVGEDGPTHQPVEHLATLRAMPGLDVVRPCDANEAAEAWRHIMTDPERPAALALTRQPLPPLDRTVHGPASGLALDAHHKLAADGVPSRVVSLPSWELFEHQSTVYREEVLPPSIHTRVAIEQGSRFGWERYVGREGAVIGLDTFGSSGPMAAVTDHFGFTAEAVTAAALIQLGR